MSNYVQHSWEHKEISSSSLVAEMVTCLVLSINCKYTYKKQPEWSPFVPMKEHIGNPCRVIDNGKYIDKSS